MNNFKLIQEHFTQLHCPNCDACFSQESVKLIREEKDYWVVKVSCEHCNHSPGFAIVGIEYEEVDEDGVIINKPLELGFDEDFISRELFKAKKIKPEKPPISVDDVLDAHEFFKNLGSDWTKYLKDLP